MPRETLLSIARKWLGVSNTFFEEVWIIQKVKWGSFGVKCIIVIYIDWLTQYMCVCFVHPIFSIAKHLTLFVHVCIKYLQNGKKQAIYNHAFLGQFCSVHVKRKF